MNVLKTLFIFFYQSRVIQWRSIKYIGKVELDHFKIYETKKCGNNFILKAIWLDEDYKHFCAQTIL